MRFNLSTRDNKLAIILAPVFVLAFPFVNLFIYHQYSFLHLEVAVLFTGIVIVGLVFGVIQLSHPLVRVVFLSFLITLALTLQLDLSLYFLLGTFIVLIAAGFVLHRSFSKLTIVFFLTMSITGLVQGSENIWEQADVQPRDPSLPVYIHVILDGHIGIDGIPLDVSGGRQMKRELTEFFARHGFTQYNRVYSRYVATINSLRNLFDFTNTTANNFRPHDKKNRTNHVLNQPKYFQILNEHGYALRIVHPHYLDYCSQNEDWVSYCHWYPDLNLQSIEDSELPIKEKIYLVLALLLQQSDLAEKYYQSLRKRFDLAEIEVSKVPGINPKMMQVLFDDLRQNSNGYAHVWHLLFPHAPFVYAADCTIQMNRPFGETRAVDNNIQATLVDDKIEIEKGHNTTESRAIRYQNYFSQIRCGMLWLEQMFTALQEMGAYDDAIIIVHGDHGSKISKLVSFSLWQDQLQNTDYVDTYSTLFAVKWKHPPVQSAAFLSLNEIFTKSINRLFSVNLQVSTEPYVYVQSADANTPLEKVKIKDFLSPISEVQ